MSAGHACPKRAVRFAVSTALLCVGHSGWRRNIRLVKRVFSPVTAGQSERTRLSLTQRDRELEDDEWGCLRMLLSFLTAGDRKRGANANLTVFLTLTISEQKWILLLITHQRGASRSWLILWGTCSVPCRASSLCSTHHMFGNGAQAMRVFCVREMLQGKTASSKTQIKLERWHCCLTVNLPAWKPNPNNKDAA